MGYINVQRNLGGGGSSTYIAEKVKIKETVEAPDKWWLNKDLTVINSSYPPTMSSDLVANNFSNYAGYKLDTREIVDTSQTYASLECCVKFRYSQTYSSRRSILVWDTVFTPMIKASTNNIEYWSIVLNDWTTLNYTMNPNTWYWLKQSSDSSGNATYSISTDGENFTVITTENNGISTIYSDWFTRDMTLGHGSQSDIGGLYYGEIDLKETYIKFNGTKTFYAIYQPYHKYYDNTEEGDN